MFDLTKFSFHNKKSPYVIIMGLKIVNNENSAVAGLMNIIVQRNVGGNWVTVPGNVISETITIPANGLLKLDTGLDSNDNQVFPGFNDLNINVNEVGQYRVLVQFTENGFTSESSWEFGVV